MLIREAIERAVDYDDWFIREVDKGLAQIDAGQVPTPKAVGTLMDQKLAEHQSRRRWNSGGPRRPPQISVGARLYLPTTWLTPAAARPASHSDHRRVPEKGRHVLSLLLQVLASAITVTAIVADAEFGDCFAVGRLFHTLGLSNVLGYFDRRCVQSNVKTGCSTSGATATITI